jgi:hypothetical protein
VDWLLAHLLRALSFRIRDHFHRSVVGGVPSVVVRVTNTSAGTLSRSVSHRVVFHAWWNMADRMSILAEGQVMKKCAMGTVLVIACMLSTGCTGIALGLAQIVGQLAFGAILDGLISNSE